MGSSGLDWCNVPTQTFVSQIIADSHVRIKFRCARSFWGVASRGATLQTSVQQVNVCSFIAVTKQAQSAVLQLGRLPNA